MDARHFRASTVLERSGFARYHVMSVRFLPILEILHILTMPCPTYPRIAQHDTVGMSTPKPLPAQSVVSV